MLLKTHVVISVFFILLFLPLVSMKFLFVAIVLISTLIPDLDTEYSAVGRFKFMRPFQKLVRHREILHSFTFLFVITFGLVLFFPVISFAFFLGYASHLFTDTFTVRGLKVFYPLNKRISGNIRTGGKSDISLMVVFLLADLFLLVFYIF